jgi:hypothetical protein
MEAMINVSRNVYKNSTTRKEEELLEGQERKDRETRKLGELIHGGSQRERRSR